VTTRYTTVRHYSSPFRVFIDTVKEQMSKSKEVKTLQDESTKLSDSDALKRAKELFEKAKVI
jgi:import inner membrane translocase subunit TIM44